MKFEITIHRCAVLLGSLWLVIAPSLRAQTGTDLAKQSREILDTYGLETPSKHVAIYLWRLMEGKKETAYEMFETKESVKRALEKSAELKYLKAHIAEVASLDFVGFRMVSTTVISFLYVMTTREGPVAVRIDSYSFGKKLVVSQIRMTREWEEMMRLVDSVKQLPASMEFKMESKPEPVEKPRTPQPDVKKGGKV